MVRPMNSLRRRGASVLMISVAGATLVAGCGSSSSSSSSSSPAAATAPAAKPQPFTVVAGENFWGSIATQLAGDRATVKSIIVDPDTDPHSYQATAQDARTVAGAKLAIVNGIGYDAWMDQALKANPTGGRTVLDVGDVLGLKEGDNPHQWYDPASVTRIVDEIVTDYGKLDPADAAYFTHQKQTFLTKGLARYDALRTEIRRRYAGVPVGYSESIFQPLGADLGLKLATPYSFAKAVAEGTDISARDKQTVDAQAQQRQIKVWVYNSQNATPDVKRINDIAKAQHIPIATVTETLSPASDDFEQWQVAQLQGLQAALHKATGR